MASFSPFTISVLVRGTFLTGINFFKRLNWPNEVRLNRIRLRTRVFLMRVKGVIDWAGDF
jgi:hypothetical protein